MVRRAAAATAAALLAPAAAHACAVCYGQAEAPVLDATRLSIVFLLALTYLLLGGGIALFVALRRRSLATAGIAAIRGAAGQREATEGPT